MERATTTLAGGLNGMNSAEMCENNWGQGEVAEVKAKPHIWYYLEPRLNVPDQQRSIPPWLFGRN